MKNGERLNLEQIRAFLKASEEFRFEASKRKDLNAVAERLLDFQHYRETTARPFEWKFTRHDPADLPAKTSPPR